MTNPTPHGQVPEALRLAEEISNLVCSSEAAAKTIAAAADELCRLHVENASLRAALAKWGTQAQAGAVPLTDEQLAEMMRETWGCASIAPRHAMKFARAIEAAHGIGIKGGQHGAE